MSLCAQCCRRLESLPGDDTLVGLLRESVGKGPCSAAVTGETRAGPEDTGDTGSWAGSGPEVPAEQDTALNVTPFIGPGGAAVALDGRF